MQFLELDHVVDPCCMSDSSLLLFAPIAFRPASPSEMFDIPDRETVKLQKFGKLLAGPNTNLGELPCSVT